MKTNKEKRICSLDQQQHVLSFLSLLSSIYILIIVACLIQALFGNGLTCDGIDYILKNFNLELRYFMPEKAEKLQFFTLSVMFPFLYIIFFNIYQRIKSIQITETVLNAVQICETAGVIGLVVFLHFKAPQDYFFIVIKSIPEIMFFLVVSFWALWKYQNGTKKSIAIINSVLILASFLILKSLFGIYYTAVYDLTSSCLHHFSAYFSPVYKVFSGLVIGVDFDNMYGFYPYLYELFFKFTNGISIEKFSLINTVMIILSILFASVPLLLNIKNKVLALVFMSAYVYYFYVFNLLSNMDMIYYLQFTPHRIFFITLIMALGSIYLKISNPRIKKIIFYAGFLISSIAVVWNFESGLTALTAWTAMLLYLEISKIQNKESNPKNVFKIIAIALLAFLSSFAAIELITYLKSGVFLNLNSYFYYQSIFYKSGYYMLKMPLFTQPWMLFILIYAVALVKSINILFFDKENKCSLQKGALYLLLTVVGMCIFVYYQGRSHILVLGGVVFPAILLVGLFANEYLTNFFNNKDDKFASKISLIKFVLIFGVTTIVGATTLDIIFFSGYEKQLNQQKQVVEKNGYVKQSFDFIKANTEQNEKLDIITTDSDVIYLKLRQKDKLPFASYTDWAAKVQYDKIFDYLMKSKNTLIIDSEVFQRLNSFENEKLHKLIRTKGYALRAVKSIENEEKPINIFIYEQ